MIVTHEPLHTERVMELVARFARSGRRGAQSGRRVVTGCLMFLVLSSVSATAQEVSRQEMKGLDQQVQEIKSDMLGIAAELAQLEETLLFPSGTQVALFVSLGEGDPFRLDSVEILLDGEAVARHVYSFQELEALRKGGVQRIYTGNVRTGAHTIEVSFKGRRADGADFSGRETLEFEKRVGPKIVELALAERSGSASIQLAGHLAGR